MQRTQPLMYSGIKKLERNLFVVLGSGALQLNPLSPLQSELGLIFLDPPKNGRLRFLFLKKKGLSLIFILTNPLMLCCMRVLCSFTPFISAFFVFPRMDLVLLNLISKYVITAIEQFLKKQKHCRFCCVKVNFFHQ